MALLQARISVELREVELKNKPAALLEASPKGTVPVLVLPSGNVIDESLDIMRWALEQNDPDLWLLGNPDDARSLITFNDTAFKKALDRYKYPARFDLENGLEGRRACDAFFRDLDARLQGQRYLSGADITLVDIALFPFVRQAALVDPAWFDGLPYARLQQWLGEHLNSRLFHAVMGKFAPWQPGDPPIMLAAFGAGAKRAS